MEPGRYAASGTAGVSNVAKAFSTSLREHFATIDGRLPTMHEQIQVVVYRPNVSVGEGHVPAGSMNRAKVMTLQTIVRMISLR